MRWLGPLSLLAGVVALGFVLVAGPGTRLELWHFSFGFQLLRWAAYAGIAAAAVGLLALCLRPARAGRVPLLVLAVLVGLAAATPPLYFQQTARSVPPINDINTDIGAAKFAEAQRKAYPDIGPLELAVPPDEAFRRALAAARDSGWEVAATDAAARRLEAVATTPWFGFRDDVTVRVSAAPGGSRIDVHSRSRVGRGDAGTNARRVREYLQRLR